jgi:hypothetical protein
MAYALRMGEEWIDRRIKRARRGIGVPRARVISMIGTLRKTADSSNLKPPHPVQSLSGKRRESFTFKQFKSALAESGLNLNDKLLQKSYAALMKLRSQQQLSWAEAKKKVKRSQEDLKAGSVRRRPSTARLPLTERDWRKIG